jgi:glucosamine 6-phosphate synthetase-like amidotransferase/phosphosugar isomerase protein
MCGIAGFNLTRESAVPRTGAARVLLAGIAERGADAAGYAYRDGASAVCVHKQRSGASELLAHVSLPDTTGQLLVHVRDYTKGHPRIEANNHPVRHGPVVGVHNGVVLNDDALFERHGWERHRPEMTVDSEAIFALAAESSERPGLAALRGSLATAWLDERHPAELNLARGVGRPLWLGHGRHETFFASTPRTLELVQHYVGLRLSIAEVPEGSHAVLHADGEIEWTSFEPDREFDETPLPAVRAPEERDSCLRLLPALFAAAL